MTPPKMGSKITFNKRLVYFLLASFIFVIILVIAITYDSLICSFISGVFFMLSIQHYYYKLRNSNKL